MEELIASPLLKCFVKKDEVPRKVNEGKSYHAILFRFENGWLECLPITDSDEVELSFFSNESSDLELEGYHEHQFEHLAGRLNVIWKCKNTNGYDDMVVLGFQHLDPSLAIVCEAGVLNVFSVSGPLS